MNEDMKKAKEISVTEALTITACCIYLWVLKFANFYHACRHLLATVIALGVSVVILMIIIDYPPQRIHISVSRVELHPYVLFSSLRSKQNRGITPI